MRDNSTEEIAPAVVVDRLSGIAGRRTKAQTISGGCFQTVSGSAWVPSLIRIDLPAGHYVPLFRRNTNEEADDSKLVTTTPAIAASGRSKRLHTILTLTLAALCQVLAALLVAASRGDKTAQSGTPVASLPEGLEWFRSPFLPPAEPPLIVIPNHLLLRAAHDGDSPQTLATGHEIPKDQLPEFCDTIHFHELKLFLFAPSLTDFTSVGETMGLVSLSQMFSNVGIVCSSRDW